MSQRSFRLSAPTAVAVAGLLGVFWSQFVWVSPTNFGGYDEWLILNMASQCVLSIPNANRPLGFLWHLAPGPLAGHGFVGFWWAHAAYLSLTGVVVLWAALRLAPGCLWAAFLSGTFAAVWAPADLARLSTVQMIINSGSTFAAFLAVALLIESRVRGSRLLLAVAIATAVLAALSYEASLGVILAAPILLLLLPPRSGLWVWIGAWEIVAVAMVIRFVVSTLSVSGGSYQAAIIGVDLVPHRMIARLIRQFAHHLLPLSGARVSIGGEAALSGLIFLTACLGVIAVVGRRAPAAGVPPRRCLALVGVGLLLAAVAYAPFTLGRLIQGANRTELLAAPGIGIFLGFMAQALASRTRPAWRTPLFLLAGTWVIMLGTAHVVQMQRAWSALSYYTPQVTTLRQIVQLAPDVRRGTLLLLIDSAPRPTWPASFGFRHAIAHLHEGRAVGHVFGAATVFHPIRFGEDAIHIGADPLIASAWRSPASQHRYEETVALERGEDGSVRISEEWPVALPALPPGSSYRPIDRLLPGTPRRQWGALGTLPLSGP